jgi:uncharacterized repeat protein (TIGR03803 family)
MKSIRFDLSLLVALILSFNLAVSAQTVTFVAGFTHTNGDGPAGSVIQGTDGNFYGTTSVGGVYGHGNVFRVTPSGTITSIYAFCAQKNCPDGSYPYSSPILGSDGNLYGVVRYGGSDTRYEQGWGTIYKMTLSGRITILHTFCQSYPCLDGATPRGIVQGGDGNFYGTTLVGGASKVGVVFVITPGGKYKVLHNFCSQGASCPDGGYPVDPPILGRNGNLYGATTQGGTMGGGGVLYELSPTGAYRVIYDFCSSSKCSAFSAAPSTITQDASGNFFGTTFYGGADSSGTVFELSATNQYNTLHEFLYSEGTVNGGLTLANDGNFYSTTANGDNQFGSIYEITPAGVYTTLYSFVFGDDISAPYGPIFQGTNGNLYGTAEYGNYIDAYEFGAVFQISNNISPLVETAPRAGKIGNSILILGNGLTGSTSVTFNGVSAAFTVNSDTYITATVPTSATTGTVSVVTPSGTLNSSPQFLVTN